MKLIQIGGIARTGKSVLGRIIADKLFELNYVPILLPFAKALKDEAASLGFSKEGAPLKYRKFCQTHGATARKKNPDHWVEKTLESIKYYLTKEDQPFSSGQKYEFILIQDDLRYMNEVAMGIGLNSWRIFLSSGNREVEDIDAPWRKHESEELSITLDEQVKNSIGIHSLVHCKPSKDNKEPTVSELYNVILLNDKTKEDLEIKIERYLQQWLNSTEKINNESLLLMKGIINGFR